MSLGVIPKNENKREEMTEIVETLQEYVPGNGDQLLKVGVLYYMKFEFTGHLVYTLYIIITFRCHLGETS